MINTKLIAALLLLLNLTAVAAAAAASPPLAERADKVACWEYCRDYCCVNRCYDTFRLTPQPCGDNYLSCCQGCDCYNNQACDDKCRAKETKCHKPFEKKLAACLQCCVDTGKSTVASKKEADKCAKRYAKCQDPSTVFTSCTGADGPCIVA